MMFRGGMAALVPLALGACLAEPPPPEPFDDTVPAADGGPPADAPTADQLLANRDFEGGADGWQITGNAMIGDPEALGVSIDAASGAIFAQVGRKNSTVNGIRQLVTVPEWVATLRLSGQHCFDSDDEDASRDDELTVLILDANGVELETLLSASNAELGAICNWTWFEVVAADSHAGEEIQLSLVASSDEADVTAFWFDDLQLVASPE